LYPLNDSSMSSKKFLTVSGEPMSVAMDAGEL
jgi:hypothetical protein